MAQKDSKPVSWLVKNITEVNLMERLGPDMCQTMARRAVQGYDTDEASRSDWRKKTEDGLKVAMQETEAKTFPWKDASNVKFPLIASASIQFAARAYPQIVNGTDVVKTQVIGSDPHGEKEARGKRVGQHMSWQVLDQMPEWEPDHDKLLHGLPVMGTMFKKTLFDTLYSRNRSICCNPFEVVINIKHKGDLTTCRRITHVIPLYRNEVIERENSGLYAEGVSAKMTYRGDEVDEQENFIEQHCWYDCDGDGYDEPYIVTVHYDSQTPCRVVANYEETGIALNSKGKIQKIDKVEYFTKYSFIPSPNGDFYDIGFAHLLGPINESMSTLINQLIDAGSLANTGGGFISKGLRWQGGRLEFELGEWKPVDTVGTSLKDAILPLPVRDPSPVLFQLLGLLNETGQKLAAVTDAMTGEMPSQNTPATTVLAVIEQGLKVFTAIYKRVFLSMKQEFKKMYRLNSLYMDEEEYFRVLDEQNVVFRKDYSQYDLDIVPVADPSMASEAQKLARANALMQTFAVNPDPMAKAEILRQYYDAIGAKNINLLVDMKKVEAMVNEPPPPNPELLKIQLETQKASDKYDLDLKNQEIAENEAIARIQNIEADTRLKTAQTVKAIADAEAVEPGQQMEQYRTYLEDIKAQQQHEREMLKLQVDQEEEDDKAEKAAEGGPSGENESEPNQPAGPAGMAQPSGNPPSAGGIELGTGSPQGPPLSGPDIDAKLAGANSPSDFASVGADIRNKFTAGHGPGGAPE